MKSVGTVGTKKRTRVFLDISIGGRAAGQLLIEVHHTYIDFVILEFSLVLGMSRRMLCVYYEICHLFLYGTTCSVLFER